MLLELGQNRRAQGISITPLIDVVFILLLFFMLSSTFSRTQQIDVMTATKGVAQAQQASKAKRLLLQNDKQVLFDSNSYATHSTSLLAQLKLFSKQNSELIIVGTPQVSVQALILLVDIARGAGIEKINISESANL